ncbi:MAG: hypothetical protein A2Z51_07670 [Deltaproteobacteria bacterium RBG_19FT_COMBO_52_11]|nr:MAG: hypothetical protein A2Z51_07670 [Deltaproteobacteria bacterium RBG_19FT_COMBO_52_11]
MFVPPFLKKVVAMDYVFKLSPPCRYDLHIPANESSRRMQPATARKKLLDKIVLGTCLKE